MDITNLVTYEAQQVTVEGMKGTRDSMRDHRITRQKGQLPIIVTHSHKSVVLITKTHNNPPKQNATEIHQ